MHQYPIFIFVIKPYMFQASSVTVIRGYPLYTGQLVRFMQVMWPLPSRVRMEREFQPDSARKRSHSLHEAYQLPCVQWIAPDDGHRRRPKHVGFYDKNTVWILMHLVDYFYEAYHDERSREHKVSWQTLVCILRTEHKRLWACTWSGPTSHIFNITSNFMPVNYTYYGILIF